MLADLPPEVLIGIVLFLPTAQQLRYLGETCRRLHTFVEAEGWRVFVLNKFPSIETPPMFKEAAHALTTLSRNLDRRAFLAVELEPKQNVLYLPRGTTEDRWTKRAGQTMGYQAVLDSYQVWQGSEWSSTKDVVAWGAGADLVMNITHRSPAVANAARRNARRRSDSQWESFARDRSKFQWVVYREKEHREGRDDVTSVHLLQFNGGDAERTNSNEERLVVGRASGGLDLIHLSVADTSSHVQRRYETFGVPVRSTDLAPSTNNQLAACLGDHRLALFALNGPEHSVSLTTEISSLRPGEVACRTWSTRFLSSRELAVGRGPSKEMVHVYGMESDGLRKQPLRVFRSGAVETPSTSVYPIVTIPSTFGSEDRSDGVAFLSGAFDGGIRLHDMRSPRDCEEAIVDPIDSSSIFSLVMIGRERVIAGSAMNSLLKVFDLRMTGGKVYSYLGLESLKSRDAEMLNTPESPWGQPGFGGLHESGFNIFASEKTNARSRHDALAQRHRQSPVYSLSRPCPSSSSLYAGLENYVVHFNFTSLFDAHPDPVYKASLQRMPIKGRPYDPVRSWYPSPNSQSDLTLYEQMGDRSMRILRQRGPFHEHRPAHRLDHFRRVLKGYDERLWDDQEGCAISPFCWPGAPPV